MSLVLKSSLIKWIELQLLDPRADELLAWAKILENIVTSGDIVRLEQVTNGEWKSATIRPPLRSESCQEISETLRLAVKQLASEPQVVNQGQAQLTLTCSILHRAG